MTDLNLKVNDERAEELRRIFKDRQASVIIDLLDDRVRLVKRMRELETQAIKTMHAVTRTRTYREPPICIEGADRPGEEEELDLHL